jgi:hypothetical protein
MTILPVPATFCIENLYPSTNHVDLWNILIIGNDKTFVHAALRDLDMPDERTFANNRSGTVLNRELQEFFDPIFDQTLANHKLQFYMTWQGKIFLVNSYPIVNQLSDVIGGIFFIRNFSLMPRMTLGSPFGGNGYPDTLVGSRDTTPRTSTDSGESRRPEIP